MWSVACGEARSQEEIAECPLGHDKQWVLPTGWGAVLAAYPRAGGAVLAGRAIHLTPDFALRRVRKRGGQAGRPVWPRPGLAGLSYGQVRNVQNV